MRSLRRLIALGLLAPTPSALEAEMPESHTRALPEVAAHAERLSETLDLIDPAHRQAGAKLAGWLADRYEPGKPLHVIVVCTGNSRRSILGSTLGNVAAAYHGLPEIRFHSGGTAPTAFNPRTIATLEAIGIEIEPTGSEAPRGEPDTPNPVYRIRWGAAGEPTLESFEFSKRYDDPANPPEGFAAVLVCSEADAACPAVRDASARISMPYEDPKEYDGTPEEAARYAERRDDIGRQMLSVLKQVRERVDPAR